MLGATHPVRTVGSWRPCFVRSAHLRWRLCPHGRPSTELPTWTVAFVPYEQAAGRAWCQAPPECRERQAFGSGRCIFAAVITASLPWLWQQQAVRRKCDGWYVWGAAWRSTALHEQASPASRQACLWMSLPRANPQRGKRALLAVHLQVCRFAGLQVCRFAALRLCTFCTFAPAEAWEIQYRQLRLGRRSSSVPSCNKIAKRADTGGCAGLSVLWCDLLVKAAGYANALFRQSHVRDNS